MSAIWTADTATSGTGTFPENVNFPNDGKFDYHVVPFGSDPPDVLETRIEVPVGRVDMAKMPTFRDHENPVPTTSLHETEVLLLKRYFRKDHEFRHGVFSVQSRALMDDHFGNSTGNEDSEAGSGWRAFAPLVGAANTFSRDFRTMHSDDYLFAWGGGPGGNQSLNADGVVDIGDYALKEGQPAVPRVMKGVFNLLFGSYFGQ